MNQIGNSPNRSNRLEFENNIKLIQSLLATDQKSEAISIAESCLSRIPEIGIHSLELGRLFASLGHINQAQKLFHRQTSLPVPKAQAEAYVALADLETDQEKRLDFLCSAVACFPKLASPYARIRHTPKSIEIARQSIQKLKPLAISSCPCNPLLALCLGDLFKEVGQYDMSAHWISNSNQGTNISRDSGAASKRGPDFLILGTMKSGTTSLHAYLLAHPKIVPAARKEIGYFGENFANTPQCWYEAHFPKRIPGILCGEATPSYYSSPDADKIKKLYPDAKLILLLRNPIRRAVSHYFHNLELGFTNQSFEEAMMSNLDLLEELNQKPISEASSWLFNAMVTDQRCNHYLAMGLYHLFLYHWYSQYSANQILLLDFDELAQRPSQTMKKTFQFLGLAPAISSNYEVKNRGSYLPPAKEELYRKLEQLFAPTQEAMKRLYNFELGKL